MKYRQIRLNFFLYALMIISISINAQDEIINNQNIKGLTKFVDSVNLVFETKTFDFVPVSFPIARADYFCISTKNPDEFLEQINAEVPLKTLVMKYQNLIVDKNLMVTKTRNYKGNDKIKIRSYQIKYSNEHYINIPFDSLTFSNSNQKGKYFINKYYDKHTGLTRIDGFYLLSDFIKKEFPSKYVYPIKYADMIIGNKNIFYGYNNVDSRDIFEKDKIDTLIDYYNKAIKKPGRQDNEEFSDYIEKWEKWSKKKAFLTDSLYENDSLFGDMIKESYEFAIKNKKSNDELENLVEKYISKEAALKLLRNKRVMGSCSVDSSPRDQLMKIAKLSADLNKWYIFIKSMLDLMNDNISRVSDNSLAAAARRTYFSELEKLPLDTKNLLLGISLQTSNADPDHFLGNAGKIGKVIANSPRWKEYLSAFEEVIFDPAIDQFNKLHFYNIVMNTYYYTDNDELKQVIDRDKEKIINALPYVIKNRIKNPHLELENLLIRDSVDLHRYFEIEESMIGNFYSRYSRGMTWMGVFRLKNDSFNVYFDMTMKAEDTIGSIKHLAKNINHYVQLIKSNSILNKLLTKDFCEFTINYVNGKSFIISKYCDRDDIPGKIKEKYRSMFDNALLITIDDINEKRAECILLENGEVILTRLSKDFHFGVYKFEQLVTKEEKSLFGNSNYYSYKVFDKKGKILKN